MVTRVRQTNTTKSSPRHPARNDIIEQWLTMRGVQFTFIPDFPMADIDVEASLHNQARGEAFNQDHANTLKIAQEEGHVLPALVGIPRGHGMMLVDGNHRYWVFNDAGWKTCPIYVIDSKIASDRLQDLIFEANHTNGDPPTKADAIEHAMYYVGNGMSIVEAARRSRVDENHLRSVLNKKKNDREAEDLGIPRTHWKKYSDQSKQAIMHSRTGLRREVEKTNFVRFTHNLNLSTAEVKKLIADIRGLKTEKDRMDFITKTIPQNYLKTPNRTARRRLKNVLNAQMKGVIKNITVERQEILDDMTNIEQVEMRDEVYQLIKELDNFRKALDESIKG